MLFYALLKGTIARVSTARKGHSDGGSAGDADQIRQALFVVEQRSAWAVIDHPAAIENDGAGREFEGKPGDIGGGVGQRVGEAGEGSGLEERLARIEALLGYIQPFIQQSLRPDLSQSAYTGEETTDEPEDHEEE